MPGWLRATVLVGVGLGLGVVLATKLPWGPGGYGERTRLAAELAQAHQTLARVERLAQVDRRASAQIQAELVRAEAQRAELARRIEVYRRVLVPTRAAQGLGIEDVSVFHAEPDGALHYRVVLAQGVERGQAAAGTLEMTVRGRTGSAWVDLPLVSVPYQFHYLHVIEDALPLPAGLMAQDLKLTLRPQGARASITRSFAWRSVYQPPAQGTELPRVP